VERAISSVVLIGRRSSGALAVIPEATDYVATQLSKAGARLGFVLNNALRK
jgi:hypothetical protein